METAHTQPATPDPKGGTTDPAASPPRALSLTRREVVTFFSATLSVAVITVALLMARGARSTPSAAAAAPAARPTATAAASSVIDAAVSRWTSEHQAQWLGNRRHSVAFELSADNIVSIWMGRVRPILVVRCVDKKTEAFVFTGSAIQIEPHTDGHTVRFGFDDGAEASERWPDSAEHDALFAPDGAAFAARVAHARTLKFGYTPHNATPVVATFHASGLGELMKPAARECGAKLH